MKRINWPRLGGSLLVAAALVLIVIGFAQAETGTPKVTLPEGIEFVFPTPGAIERRQAEVGADLAPGFTGALVIDGVRIPPDQLRIDNALNVVAFQARPGTDIEEFAPGPRRVTVIYWRIVDGEANGSRSFSWSFTLS